MNDKFEILKWDSDFFGIKVAKIIDFDDNSDLQRLIKELKQINVKVIYFFVEPLDIEKNQILNNIGAFLADEKITYHLNTNQIQITENINIVEYTGSVENSDLINIAKQSGEFSRFRLDQRFGNEACDKLYKQWISNSVNKIFDNVLYVYQKESKIRGIITLKNLASSGSISLIGVDSNTRGKNIGTELINKAILHYQKREVFILSVVTQKANKRACKFYEKNGFEISNIKNIYHLWI